MRPSGPSYRTICFGIGLAVVLAFATGAAGQSATTRSAPSNDQIVAWLRALKPLPKVHYSWPLAKRMLDPNNPLLIEYVRITHAASVSVAYTGKRELDAAVLACRLVNAGDPPIPATLALNYSPWHVKWVKGTPPTTTGPAEEQELSAMRASFREKRAWLADANRRYGASIRVAVVILDTEVFVPKPRDDVWNDAIVRKYDAAFDIAREFFPEARIVWAAEGFAPNLTGREKTDGVINNQLYQMPDMAVVRAQIRDTLTIADRRGRKVCAAWLALGCGGFGPHGFRYEADYDPRASWQVGVELQREPRITFIIFWPEPFCTRVSTWGRHFVAYVCGANGIAELPWSGGRPAASSQP